MISQEWGVGGGGGGREAVFTCISNSGEYTSFWRWCPLGPNSMHCRKSDSLKNNKEKLQCHKQFRKHCISITTNFKESLCHPDSNEGPYVEVSSYWSEKSQHGSHDNPNAKYPPPAKPSGQPPAGNLSDDVTKEERGENPACMQGGSHKEFASDQI